MSEIFVNSVGIPKQNSGALLILFIMKNCLKRNILPGGGWQLRHPVWEA